MQDDIVSPGELLYRRVPIDKDLFKRQVDGTLQLHSQAFADPDLAPSVDRAILRNNDPSQTQLNPMDGVLGFCVDDVRVIRDIEHAGLSYRLDVEPDPIPANNPDGEPENLAHARIQCYPKPTPKAFNRKIKVRLARLIEEIGPTAWLIEPQDQPAEDL